MRDVLLIGIGLVSIGNMLALIQLLHRVGPLTGSRRVVDFDDPSLRDLAAFGLLLGIRFGFEAVPLPLSEDEGHRSEEIHGALLQVAGAARTMRAGMPQAQDVLNAALIKLDEAQSSRRTS